jgi:hypothetical protein
MLRTLTMLVTLGFGTALAAPPSEHIVELVGPVGVARLSLPDRPAPGRPVVVLVPDAPGADGRADVYVDTLLARGIATLELGLGPDTEWLADPTGPQAREALSTAIEFLVLDGHLPSRIGLLGFGLGGRAALAHAGPQPVAALYACCVGLPTHGADRALVLQGGRDLAGCDALPRGGRLDLQVIPDAGHGWDIPGAYTATPAMLVPDPAGGPRLRAAPDLHAMVTAADVAVGWLERCLNQELRAAR